MGNKISRRSFVLAAAITPALHIRAGQETNVQLIKTPQEGLQPQAAVDSRGVIHLIYLYGDPAAADIGYVRKRPGDLAFSAPIRVNHESGSATAIGTVRGASLAIGESNRIHVAWNGSSTAEPKGPADSAPMLYSRLSDDGKTFEPERNLMRIAGVLNGGGGLAADRQGAVYVTWHAEGQQNGQRILGEAHRRVWMARSLDSGKTFETERAVSPADLGACGCCGMGAVTDDEGTLYVLYRSARESVHRDMYLLRSRDKGAKFEAIDLHPWQIDACPMSTVSLTSSKGKVLLAWETKEQIYFSAIEPAAIGVPVSPAEQSKNSKHPSIGVNARGELLVAWTEGTGWKRGGTLAWQSFDASGRPLGSKQTSQNLAAWNYGAVAPARDRFILVS